MQLRGYQTNLINGLYSSWGSGNKNVICVAPTGAGKTVIMAAIAYQVNAPMCLIAHRQELVQQISMALAAFNIPHRLIAPQTVASAIIAQHINAFGKHFVDTSNRSPVAVVSVDTLNARQSKLMQWGQTVQYWATDECHHVLMGNKWGKAVEFFPHARGVGFTATPMRCDKKSLAASQGGVFHDLINGPSMRELIDAGNLSDYRIFGPPQSIDRAKVKISKSTGEFSQPSLREVAAESTITGDIVQHYLTIAPGARGITFTVDIESAERTAVAFNAAGVAAVAVSSKTNDSMRNEAIRRFKNGEILQLCNVDLFGEGFDVPAVEVVSMGRPTQSFGLYAQQFGRALRPLPGKSHGIIIDHVGNVVQHGLPDAVTEWQLEGEMRGTAAVKDPDLLPYSTCEACFMGYERISNVCPHCGHVHEPEDRSQPRFVDGDLVEFSEELLADLRRKRKELDSDFVPVPVKFRGTKVAHDLAAIKGRNQMAQAALRDSIAQWAGVRKQRGMGDSEIQRRFFHRFGIDVLSAQSLKHVEAGELQAKIIEGYWT